MKGHVDQEMRALLPIRIGKRNTTPELEIFAWLDTAFSLDPKLNDIRHLRADQEFCGVIGCFGLLSTHPLFRTSHN